MKTIIITLTFVFSVIVAFAQNQNSQTSTVQQELVSGNKIFRLFPTQNYWTFIKLDTRNGKMWQVHFTVSDDGFSGESFLNMLPLVPKDKEVNGRFTLYSTENMYNFLLLDQIDGKVYQVQWSMEFNNRGVIPIE